MNNGIAAAVAKFDKSHNFKPEDEVSGDNNARQIVNAINKPKYAHWTVGTSIRNSPTCVPQLGTINSCCDVTAAMNGSKRRCFSR